MRVLIRIRWIMISSWSDLVLERVVWDFVVPCRVLTYGQKLRLFRKSSIVRDMMGS